MKRSTSKRDIFVASKCIEAFCSQSDLDKGHVRAVHGLERKTLRGYVPNCFFDEVFQRIHGLLEDFSFWKAALEHLIYLFFSTHSKKTQVLVKIHINFSQVIGFRQ